MEKPKLYSLDNSKPALVVFTGDNFFAYILCAAVCRTQKVIDIVISHGTTHSYSKVWSIFRSTSTQYFVYRVIIQLISKLTPISDLGKLNDINLSYVTKKSDFESLNAKGHYMGVACNFDLIIPDSYIKSRRGGVLNVHASDLPLDRGISPVVWAFCRGDHEVYISYYLMDGGIDTGDILKKDVVKIDRNWSLFRTYCEVILSASKSIEILLDEVAHNSQLGSNSNCNTQRNSNSADEKAGTYNAWPTKKLHQLMKKNGKRYFRLSDTLYAANLIRQLRDDNKLNIDVHKRGV